LGVKEKDIQKIKLNSQILVDTNKR
jgi:hypothetical protein